MKRTQASWIIGSAVLLSSLVACQQASNDSKEKKEPAVTETATIVSRGEYLVNSIGCDDCHSPKRMGAHGPELIPELRLSGYPQDRPVGKVDTNAVKGGWVLMGADLTSAVGMWGMSFGANITSDSTGIGAWTEEQFLTAIRHGKSKGIETNRPLLPPMPWVTYKNLNDEDLKAVFAYLKSTKPVKNIVPQPISFSDL